MMHDVPRGWLGHVKRAASLPPSLLLQRVAARLFQAIKCAVAEIQASVRPLKISDDELQKVLVNGVTVAQLPGLWRSTFSNRFFVCSEDKNERVALLRQISSEASALIVAEADRICEHTFDLLGSGPMPLGERIDWHVDFKTGHRWNPKTYCKRIRPAPYPGGYDIKVPWELSRCEHFVRLGQAYWITGDEKYAREFVAEVEDWIASNPWPWGVNWACTMDVAIRAVNWLWGLAFFLDSPTVTDEFLVKLARTLLIHGRHIMNNLEGSRESRYTSNHYLSNLVGLIYLGICCLYFKEAQQWLELGTSELWNEMSKQVYPDGVDYEGSIPYHRLVTEMCFFGVLLCQRAGITVPEDVLKRLKHMFEFVMCYLKPNGLAPQFGDADDGRLVKLATSTDEPPEPWLDRKSYEILDHRYLLGLGAVFFDRSDFATAAGRLHEDVVWVFGPEGVDKFRALHEHSQCSGLEELRSRAFTQGGIFLMRDGDLYLAIDAGPNRGHAHNDALSFELVAAGVTFLVDPGTYVYTSDQHSRHWFRRTAAHNTVVVDGQEMNHIWPGRVFEVCDDAQVAIHEWHSNEQYDLFDGEHSGYRRLAEPVIHRRQVFFDKTLGFWVIRDLMLGEGEHSCEFWLHFIPAVQLREGANLALWAHVSGSDTKLLMVMPLNSRQLRLDLEPSWVSPSYGIRKRAPVACYSKRVKAPAEFGFALIPLREDMPVSWMVLDAATQHFATLRGRHPVQVTEKKI